MAAEAHASNAQQSSLSSSGTLIDQQLHERTHAMAGIAKGRR
jgi:hypothetical protein